VDYETFRCLETKLIRSRAPNLGSTRYFWIRAQLIRPVLTSPRLSNSDQTMSSKSPDLLLFCCFYSKDGDSSTSPQPPYGLSSEFLRLVALVKLISIAPLMDPNDPHLGEKQMLRHFDVLRRNRFVLAFQTSDHQDLFGFELVSSVRLFQA
jgi:hypothetical protein